MEINRSYKIKLNGLQQQALRSITNQTGVMDKDVFTELVQFVDSKLTEAFYAGLTEAHLTEQNENTCK